MRVVTNFSIIIYTRLSKEEQGKTKEEQSKSIRNQLEICRKFISEEQKDNPTCEFTIVAELKDDGVSGTTFERDEFSELLRLIEAKKANMVITKDLSRLGRDHIKTDDYIETFFPEHNVRYVAIMESVDTYNDTVSNDIAPIINWSNDHFAKQTSKKIKRQFDLLRKEGKWTGGEPPLGYQINPKVKYQFIVEPKGAFVVQKIFSLALENKSLDTICTILMKEKIPLPSVIKGSHRLLNQETSSIWSSSTVRAILQNEMYLGHMIQGKTTRLNHKSKTIVYLPKEQWIKVLNTHEAIIDLKTFETVQLLIQSNKHTTRKSYEYLLKGLLKCRECGRSISVQHFENRKTNYTICNYYRKYGRKKKVCSAHRFSYETLEKMVLERLKMMFKNVDSSRLVKALEQKRQPLTDTQIKKQKLEQGKREIRKLEQQLDILYDDKLNGLLSERQYQRIRKTKEEGLELLRRKQRKQQEEWEKCLQDQKEKPNYEKIVQDFLSFQQPSRILITKLIDVINIGEDGTIQLFLKIQKPSTF